jgi:hypothetical protein
MVAKLSEHRIGRHAAWMGADGVVVQRVVGPASLDELRSIADWERGFWEGRASLQVLVDLSAAGPLAGSLKDLSALYDGAPLRYVAIIGASFSARSLANVVIRAARLLGGRALDVRFFRDEAAGRAWLAERRARTSNAAWA